MEIEQLVFTIIVHSGSARGYCFEALGLAREGKFAEAAERMKQAGSEITEAHRKQTGMLQQEAGGNKQEVSMLLVHAQDHLMNALLARDLIQEMIVMYKEKYEDTTDVNKGGRKNGVPIS